ncbi:MAG: hypothetical protein PHI49_01690 [Halothiobacillaceae bacterium]|nr:hypothetical protein [Halothiobacillaceae bacterium]
MTPPKTHRPGGRPGERSLHVAHDALGAMIVAQDRDTRTLYFGNDVAQTRLFLNAPDTLAFGYYRAMTAALAFMDAPRRILLYGLGGGALARHLLRLYPQCTVTAVEYRAALPEIAHDWFDLPRSSRLTIHIDDAFAHARTLESSSYDLILVDLFDAQGMSELDRDDFIAHLAHALSREGMLSANLWRSDWARFVCAMRAMEDAFAGCTLYLPVPERGNAVALASHHPLGGARLAGARKRASSIAETGREIARLLSEPLLGPRRGG